MTAYPMTRRLLSLLLLAFACNVCVGTVCRAQFPLRGSALKLDANAQTVTLLPNVATGSFSLTLPTARSAGVWHLDGSGNITFSLVDLSVDVTGALAISTGGTGATTATAAINNLLPSQTSQSGKYLTTDGTNTSWGTVVSGVTSVSNSDGTLTISPTTGAVVASLNLANANIWTVLQTFPHTTAEGNEFITTVNSGTTTINAARIATLNQNTTGSAAKWTTARLLANNSVDGSADAAFANKFIVQGTADAGLSGAQFLGALGTGILKNTTTTGVLSIAVAGDFPTLNQSTTGSAATLTTPRAIYGNNFDGSAALTQIIASTYGGTGNGFAKISGPATSEKTFTLPNASAAILTDNAAVTVAQGGTGLTTLTAHDVLVGNGTSNVTPISPSTSGFVLTSNGTSSDPTFQVLPSAPTGADPTATIGTAAVNGSASTFMRSDAAPAFGNLTGVVTSTGMATAIANGAITNAMLANGAVANLSGTNTGDQTITLTGDVTGSGTGSFATTLATVTVSKGGTGATTLASNGVLYGNGTSAIQALAVNSTATNKFLTQSSSTAPAWNTIVAGDVPTLNQSTTGSAATLTTARGIYGNNFDGSAALTQIIASTYGGTGNGFAKLSGPASSEKTFTLPNASATILTDNAAVTVAQGGTGLATLTNHALQVGAGTSSPTQLGLGTTTTVLHGAAAGDPTWSSIVNADIASATIDLTAKVTGALPVANGGTSLATLTSHSLQVGNGTSAITQLAVPASGTLLTGVASSDPAFSATPTLGVAGTTTGQLKLANATGSNVITVAAPASPSAYTFTLPVDGGTNAYVLQTNGSGTTSWVAGGGGAVSSVANSDGTLTISPTTGAVVASLALGHANIWTGAQTLEADNIATTYTNILLLTNETASTNAVRVQQSPSLLLRSHVWDQTATAADSIRDFRLTVVPATSTNPLVTKLLFRAGNTLGGYTTPFSISDAAIADLASGGAYSINGTNVLSGSTLGFGVTASSLTSVGTIATGVWNGTAVDVAHGGTGDASFTAYAVTLGGTTSTGALQDVGGVGTGGQCLMSNGASSKPSWSRQPMNVSFDGEGAVLQLVTTGYFTATTAGTITKWYVECNPSGSVTVDLLRNGTSIIGSGNKPSVTSGTAANAAANGSWTSTAIAVGDHLSWQITAATTVTYCTVSLIFY